MGIWPPDDFGKDPPPPPNPGDGFDRRGEKFVVSASGKCADHNDGGEIWCVNERDCPNPNQPDDPCLCLLLRAKKPAKPSRRKMDKPKWQPDPGEPKNDGGQLKYPYDPEHYWYLCVCVRRLEKPHFNVDAVEGKKR